MSERPAPASEVGRALASRDPEERRRAASQLASVPPPRVVPLVLVALGDEDWRVRKEATLAARECLPSEELVVGLVGALATGDVGLCNAAVDVLGAAGAAATPHLTDALARLDADGRKLVVEALGRTRDPAALPPLRRALADADPNIRQAATESVAGLSAIEPDAVEGVLSGLLHDPDPIVRLSALSGLDALGAILPWETLEPLLDDATVRPLALAAVARAGHAGAPAVLARALGASTGRAFDAALAAFALVPLDPIPEAALAALRAAEPAVSERLVRAATTWGEAALPRRRTALLVGAALGERRMIAVAIDALGEPDLGDAARIALERLGAPAVDALVARLEGPTASSTTSDGDPFEEDARALCVEALAHIAERVPTSRGLVLSALRRTARARGHANASRASASALYALGALGEAEDLALAESIFLSSEDSLVHAAESALASLATRHAAAARALWDAAESSADTAALSARPAAVALGALAEADALGDAETRALRFLSQAASSNDASTRRASVAALARIGGQPAVEALVYALADEEREVRRTAARGIGRLAAIGDNAKLLTLVRASGDPALLSAAIRAAGELLHSGEHAPDKAVLPPSRPPGGATASHPVSSVPPGSAHHLVEALAGMCEDPSADVAIAALDALRRAPADVPGRLEAMARALHHPDVDVVKTAILKLAGALERRAADPDAPALSSASPLSTPSPDAPARLPAGAWERLCEHLDHDLAEVRLLVAETLCEIDPARGRDVLVERARTERDPEVLAAIDAALSAAQRQKKGVGPP
ncbi:MAG: HEAT repeat domain-containing protein [Polyangiaceae bacterium]